jgi:hypothetical protein
MEKIYTLKELATLVGKSSNLIHRRLTENPRRYVVRYARREGGRWIWDREKVDHAIDRGEAIIIPAENHEVSSEEALRFFVKK